MAGNPPCKAIPFGNIVPPTHGTAQWKCPANSWEGSSWETMSSWATGKKGATGTGGLTNVFCLLCRQVGVKQPRGSQETMASQGNSSSYSAGNAIQWPMVHSGKQSADGSSVKQTRWDMDSPTKHYGSHSVASPPSHQSP